MVRESHARVRAHASGYRSRALRPHRLRGHCWLDSGHESATASDERGTPVTSCRSVVPPPSQHPPLHPLLATPLVRTPLTSPCAAAHPHIGLQVTSPCTTQVTRPLFVGFWPFSGVPRSFETPAAAHPHSTSFIWRPCPTTHAVRPRKGRLLKSPRNIHTDYEGIVCWFLALYRGTSFIRNTPLLGTYSRNIPRVLWWSEGGGLFLMSEVPL